MKEQKFHSSKANLVIDLDEVLIPPQSLLESFWVAASANWLQALRGIVRFPGNGEALSAHFDRVAYSVPARLHYCESALVSARSWREDGGRVVLVAPQREDLAQVVALHLGVFDEVQSGGADAEIAEQKLSRLFGAAGWSRLAQADIAYEAALLPREEAAPAGFLGSPVLRLIRPHQWLKNGLVFLPMLAAHQLTLGALWNSILAFVAFSLIASSTYVLNDLLDLNADRAHARKRNRPLASGSVSLVQGTLMVPVLALSGVGAALLSGLPLVGAVLVYFLLTTAYSFRIKRLVALDICTLAVLYTMRILAGSAATGIETSMWLLAFSTFFFFSLAAIKRLAELVDGVAAGRSMAHGRGYQVADMAVVSNIAVSAGLVSVLVLALYANSGPVQLLYRTPEVLWGVCLVLLFWNSRIAILTQRGQMNDDPLVFAVRDRVSLVCGALVGALALAGTLQ